MISILIISFCVLLSSIFFANSKKFADIFNLYDLPNERKIHDKPIPLVGGLIILLIILICWILLILFNFINLHNSIIFTTSLSIITIFGVIDDKIELNPNLKLFFFILFFIIFFIVNNYLVLNNLRFSSFSNEINLGYFGFLFTIFCSLLLINAINMSDGINGLSALIQIIIFSFLIYYNFNDQNLTNNNSNFSYYFSNFALFYIIILFIFLIFNLNEKVFLGDAGTFLISFILINSLLMNYKFLNFFYPENIIMLLWIPGLDMLRVFLLRLKKKSNPFYPDKNHFHHILKKIYNNKNIFCLIHYLALITISNFLIIKFPKQSLLILILTTLIYFLTIFIEKAKKNRQ